MLRQFMWHTGKRALKHKTLRRVALMGAAGAAAAGLGVALAGVGVGLAGVALWRRLGLRREEVRGQVVLITGSSRGLGLALAHEFARLGARLVICARDERELETARARLASTGTEVLAVRCDLVNPDEVRRLVEQANARFGRIDILVNNAGTMQVGPLAAQTVVDFQEAMDVMFWGAVYPTLAVLPQMVARRSGRIANITSIGGKVAMPHLLPYDCAKFAAVAFSEGLRAELAKDGVKVTTVVPGLMRTGSHVNAYFKGDNQSEYTWFSLGATLPLVSIDARRAARKIVHAIRGGRAEIILTPQAKLLAMLHGLFPGLIADLLGIVNRVLPTGAATERHTGRESTTKVSESFATFLGRKAATNLNQFVKGQTGLTPNAVGG
jgi:short-subunit dehydrogenase